MLVMMILEGDSRTGKKRLVDVTLARVAFEKRIGPEMPADLNQPFGFSDLRNVELRCEADSGFEGEEPLQQTNAFHVQVDEELPFARKNGFEAADHVLEAR